MRDPFTAQPLVSSTDSILQFNGEIYAEFDNKSTELSTDNDIVDKITANDTELVLESFQRTGVLNTLKNFRGEYAFVYFDRKSDKIFWARDCIGRRSLLMNMSSNQGLALCSVPPGDLGLRKCWTEVPAGIVFCLDLTDMEIAQFKWGADLVYPYSEICQSTTGTINRSLVLTQFESKLHDAVYCRVAAHRQTLPDSQQYYSVLFSGGIDCTLLLYMLLRIVKGRSNVTIDLLNVAFENRRIGGGFETPDRLLGQRSFQEILECTEFQDMECVLNFVQIDVPFEQVQKHRAKVCQLMYPKSSVMDFSIAVAFYFAARATGIISLSSTKAERGFQYTAPSRILFSGLGADELFAGYTRHATQFRRDGYIGLGAELSLDFGRLDERNLGRDDRMCSNWSKEVRYPYLDEAFVEFALSLPLDCKMARVSDQKADFEGKATLRWFARSVGLMTVAQEAKRAIQFGARSAKMEIGSGKVKGTDKFI
ncbi:asparagine synthase-domain-containing protein [Lipomyces oligophaga]|uniref:asparagine synthase-domain-containing protein n=1 Tax=Lipomyces oligophaga TaxID=45792 RepID=UPI0034CDB276